MDLDIDQNLRDLIEEGRYYWPLFINDLLGMPLHEGQLEYLVIAHLGSKEICDLLAAKDPRVATLQAELDKRFPDLDITDAQMVRRFLLSCANRWGKTAVIACLQIVYHFYKFGVQADSDADWFSIEYRTANIAPYSSLTEPVFFAMKNIMTSKYPVRDHETGKVTTNTCKIEWFYIEEKTINTPPYKMYFIFNSYIEHLSLMGGKGNNLQGKPYGLITYDEACRSDHLQVEMDNSILGRLLDWTAPLHLLSTPDSDSASLVYYYQLYQEGLAGQNQSYTQTGDILQNTFMTSKQIDDQIEMLEGNPLKEQMLRGEFVWGNNNLFDGRDIVESEDNALDDGIRYEEGHLYVIGVDTAIGSDEMVFSVIDHTDKPYRLVREVACKGNSKSPQLHLNDFLMLVDEYNRANNVQVVLETFNGESVRFYHDLPPHVQTITKCFGAWQPQGPRIKTDNPVQATPNAAKKADILINLRKLFASHDIKLPKLNHKTLQQLTIYKEDDKNLETDRVIALALACWWANEITNVQPLQWISAEW